LAELVVDREHQKVEESLVQLKQHLAWKQRHSQPSHLSQMNLYHHGGDWARARFLRVVVQHMEQHMVVMMLPGLIAGYPMTVTILAVRSYL
jgi:hypothetical protein